MKKYILSILGGIVLGALAFSFSNITFATPSKITSKAKTATATSTLVYMTVGAATSTTLVYDSYQVDGKNQSNFGDTFATDNATLLLQVNASSSATIINVALEFSDDSACGTRPTACDWYENNLSDMSTTTSIVSIGTPDTLSWTFASTTIGGGTTLLGAAGLNNRNNKAITIPTPLRYVRAVITLQGANGAIYGEIVPKKQTK
jgi:hypothetical protein